MTKKLIEVALPLDAINDASAYDKMPGIGPHPKGIHHWWARLPLPTARAILFASVIDDPEGHPEKWATEEKQNAERDRLFEILRRMMGKKLHTHPEIYEEARAEMAKHVGGRLPSVFDPFAGGGSIPLEASRLGFDANAADLNPVAVLLNKCNLELAPRYAGRPPANPDDRSRIGADGAWRGTHGLAADIRYYATAVLERARRTLAPSYPSARLPKEMGGTDAPVTAWLWAWTVASPNPAAKKQHVPLVSSLVLGSKNETATWIELERSDSAQDGWLPKVRTGPASAAVLEKAKLGTKAGKAQDFICTLTGTPITRAYVQAEGKLGNLRRRMLAVVADAGRRKVYLSPTREQEAAANVESARAEEARKTLLAGPLPTRAEITGGVCTAYGLATWGHLFSPRQLESMLTLSDLIGEASETVRKDAVGAGWSNDDAELYARTVVTFLALGLDRCADFNNVLCRWSASNQKVMNLFARQALPMVFDSAEANILGGAVGAWSTCSDYVADCVEVIGAIPTAPGRVHQNDAATGGASLTNLLVSTDPPYYNNISYATLSDFFYVWLRRTVGKSFPEIFGTVLTPKAPELIAAADRFGGSKLAAKEHFEKGFREAFSLLKARSDRRFPMTVYYAFKQEDEKAADDDEGEEAAVTLTTGWETLLEALVGSGFQITATWPVRASQKWRMVSMGTNALASYIVLACRVRASDAPQASRRDFLSALKDELPPAIKRLQHANIAPVDLAQAALGPGMAIYSRFSRVIDSSGGDFGVRAALAAINGVLDEVLSAQDSDYDADTRFAITWFEGHGFELGDYGEAETLATARNVSVRGVADGGILQSRAGRVRLLRASEVADNWDPATDARLSTWEVMQQLIRALEGDGEAAAAGVLARIPISAEIVRELAYRAFKTCERNGWADDARSFNGLVVAWPELVRLGGAPTKGQAELKLE